MLVIYLIKLIYTNEIKQMLQSRGYKKFKENIQIIQNSSKIFKAIKNNTITIKMNKSNKAPLKRKRIG